MLVEHNKLMFPFLDRQAELGRLRAALRHDGDALACLFGRRRLGKSRLIRELITGQPAVYYVGDGRDAQGGSCRVEHMQFEPRDSCTWVDPSAR